MPNNHKWKHESGLQKKEIDELFTTDDPATGPKILNHATRTLIFNVVHLVFQFQMIFQKMQTRDVFLQDII